LTVYFIRDVNAVGTTNILYRFTTYNWQYSRISKPSTNKLQELSHPKEPFYVMWGWTKIYEAQACCWGRTASKKHPVNLR